ncbi:MAG: flagellum-specific ATP synthase FliI, partial [Alphaproteobacteria bacterium]
TMPGCNRPEEQALVTEARRTLAVYENMGELIRLGAYKAGSDPEVDRAIKLYPQLEAFMSQQKAERGDLATGYQRMAEILSSVK